MVIYIPIWLDLLYSEEFREQLRKANLHSNMVRFIIGSEKDNEIFAYTFTFQYG